MVTIEHASAGEVDEVAALFEAYRAFYHCAPDANAARHFISQRLANRDSAILLAKDGGRAKLGGETRAASLSLETAHGNAHALPHYPSSYS